MATALPNRASTLAANASRPGSKFTTTACSPVPTLLTFPLTMLSTAGCRAVSCAYVYDRESGRQCRGGGVDAKRDPVEREVVDATGAWTARLVDGTAA